MFAGSAQELKGHKQKEVNAERRAPPAAVPSPLEASLDLETVLSGSLFLHWGLGAAWPADWRREEFVLLFLTVWCCTDVSLHIRPKLRFCLPMKPEGLPSAATVLSCLEMSFGEVQAKALTVMWVCLKTDSLYWSWKWQKHICSAYHQGWPEPSPGVPEDNWTLFCTR